ncbi:MAG: hypothetical protein KBD15_01525 [Candidatus Magasanikbacteria bacterium]|nr:hypothetical protein [Candidatus Magasanikbacteria bacterium]
MNLETGSPMEHVVSPVVDSTPKKETRLELRNFPRFGGKYTLPRGTEVSVNGGSIVLDEDMDVEIGLPSRDIQIYRQRNIKPLTSEEAASPSRFVIADQREVLVKGRIFGYVNGPDRYEVIDN